MSPELVQHYTAELLQAFLEQLANKYPGQPLRQILNNALLTSQDGTEYNTNLRGYAIGFYNQLKRLESLPDSVAFGGEGNEPGSQ